MEQSEIFTFDEVDDLIAELRTEFGDERAFAADTKAPSWLSHYCGTGIG